VITSRNASNYEAGRPRNQVLGRLNCVDFVLGPVTDPQSDQPPGTTSNVSAPDITTFLSADSFTVIPRDAS